MVWSAVVGLVAALWWAYGARVTAEPTGLDTDKILYRSLATVSKTLAVALLAAAAAAVMVLSLPGYALPAGLVMAMFGTVCAAVDGWTTWIPARWCHFMWLLVAGAAVVGVVTGGESWVRLVVAAASGFAAAAVFGLLWVFGKGGFGDVRFMLGVGTLLGLVNVWMLPWAVVLGCLIAAGVAMIRRHRKRGGMFAMAPGLWAGALIVLVAGIFL